MNANVIGHNKINHRQQCKMQMKQAAHGKKTGIFHTSFSDSVDVLGFSSHLTHFIIRAYLA